MKKVLVAPTLLIDSNRGIYSMQEFAKMYEDRFTPESKAALREELDILKAGPDHEHYTYPAIWDAIEAIGRLNGFDGLRYEVHQDEEGIWALPAVDDYRELSLITVTLAVNDVDPSNAVRNLYDLLQGSGLLAKGPQGPAGFIVDKKIPMGRYLPEVFDERGKGELVYRAKDTVKYGPARPDGPSSSQSNLPEGIDFIWPNDAVETDDSKDRRYEDHEKSMLGGAS